MRSIGLALVVTLALTACSSDLRSPVASSLPEGSTADGRASAQGNQNPIPTTGTGLCAGKETWRSVSGDVSYCVLSSDLEVQGGLCELLQPEDPSLLRYRIAVVAGPAGAYIKAPISYSARENDCGAVGPPVIFPVSRDVSGSGYFPPTGRGMGVLTIEEAGADGGVDVPPNTEKTITFVFHKDANSCGRVHSVADLLTQNGTSLSVAGFVLNYREPCPCQFGAPGFAGCPL